MCTVLGVARSIYYKFLDKTKPVREVENDKLKAAIIRIYKANKGIYGTQRIHKMLSMEGFYVSLKRVQRKMSELGLCAVTVKNTSLIQAKKL